MKQKKKVLKVLSLFAGCGGMDLGFLLAKHPNIQYEIAWANDFDILNKHILETSYEDKRDSAIKYIESEKEKWAVCWKTKIPALK